MICKNCKSKRLKKIVKIGKQPLSGFFYSKKMQHLKRYSLDLFQCYFVAWYSWIAQLKKR